jgi:hypothetical protein
MKQTQGRKKETEVEQEGPSSLRGLLGGRGKKSTPGLTLYTNNLHACK